MLAKEEITALKRRLEEIKGKVNVLQQRKSFYPGTSIIPNKKNAAQTPHTHSFL